jgi:16S rRNA (cytosine1402-N4)-methyltransferase
VSAHHEPVLLEEVVRLLSGGPGLYLDATLGDGGHAAALLAAVPGARLLGCDRDPAARQRAAARLAPYGDRVSIAAATFRELPSVYAALGAEPLAGALLDLGVSSAQIDDPARGMSFMRDGALDLRMDPTRGAPAFERLAEVEEHELARVLSEHGDVRGASKLARSIVAEARAGRLATTRELAALIDRMSGGRAHPRLLAQVFQALRIWINEEAEDLDAVLAWLPSAMRAGGVVVTLAYHSGEDRRIKRAIQAPRPSAPPRRLPWAPDTGTPEGPWTVLTRKVVKPSNEEVERNPRARSARLRAFRRNTA